VKTPTPASSAKRRSGLAGEPKELVIVPNAGHVDLYDRVDLIPFAKLTQFFQNHLKQPAGTPKANQPHDE